MALSDDDSTMLNTLGMIVSTNSFIACAQYALYGLHLTLFSVSVFVLLRRTKRRRATRCLLATTTLLFLVSTAHFVATCAWQQVQIRGYFLRPADGETMELAARRAMVGSKLRPMQAVGAWTQPLIFIVSDGVTIWRAWILFPDRRDVKALMALFVTANTSLSLYNAIAASVRVAQHQPTTQENYNIASIFLSFSTNLLATLLIAWKAKQHRVFVGSFNGERRSQAEKILVLLIETGGLFCAMQLVLGIMTLFHAGAFSALDDTAQILTEFVYSFGAILPTILIIILHFPSSRFTSQSVFASSRAFSTLEVEGKERMTTLKFATMEDGGVGSCTTDRISQDKS